MTFKQKNLLDFLKRKKKKNKNVEIPHKNDFKEIFIDTSDNNTFLHINENGIRKLICKINKEQLECLQSLDRDISPKKVRSIFPELEESDILLICEALINLLRNKSS
ncbi:MAG: hypothetical protein GF329_08595 [Candidatus Lokiarchaeota archaeon]|nr:hypothetical protein [Candidatus Lokiarchaeota archaeon]